MKLHLRIISVFLAFLMIVSTGGIAISKHICNGEIKNIAINKKAESCNHSQGKTIQCPVHKDMVITIEAEKNGCCEDTNDLIRDDSEQISYNGDATPVFEMVLLYSYPYINLIASQKSNDTQHFRDLKLPPLIHKDIPIEVQSFLL